MFHTIKIRFAWIVTVSLIVLLLGCPSTGGGGSGGNLPPAGDWTGTPYVEHAIVSGNTAVDIGPEYAGYQVIYVVTNGTSDTVSVPTPSLTGVSSLSASAEASRQAGIPASPASSQARRRPTRGFPGQHEALAPIERNAGLSTNSVTALATTPPSIGDTFTFKADAGVSDDYRPSESISTIVHEFQHMIHFYQRSVVPDDNARYDVWLNEMLSLTVEQIVIDKLNVSNVTYDMANGTAPGGGHYGARKPDESGLDYQWGGHTPHANFVAGVTPLTTWTTATQGSLLDDYAISDSFGGWFVRQFGVEALRTLLLAVPEPGGTQGIGSDYSQSAVVFAANQYSDATYTFPELLRRWGVATITSDVVAPEGYRYNNGGWFTSSAGGATYRVHSENTYAYEYYDSDTGLWYTGPAFYATNGVSSAPVAAHSNMFLIEDRLEERDGVPGRVPAGGTTITTSLPAGITGTVMLWNPDQ